MRKIADIILLIILSTACSVIRKGEGRNYSNGDISTTGNLVENIRQGNLSENSFFISKAEIDVSTGTGNEKLLASIKYIKPDKYLISVKSRTGIEVVRVFITKDTVLVNDRINRKLYYGKGEALKAKYGISESVFPVIFGDFISNGKTVGDRQKCIDGNFVADCVINGTKIRYLVDCKINKVISCYFENNLYEKDIDITYSDFIKNDNIRTPGRIEIRDLKRGYGVSIKIRKIDFNWQESIEFVPGNKYELIELL